MARRGQSDSRRRSSARPKASPSFPARCAPASSSAACAAAASSAPERGPLVGAGVSHADRRQLRAADRRAGGGHHSRHQRSARPREPRLQPVQAGRRCCRGGRPGGRDAQAATDLQLRAQILSYSRARGLFAGVTINGSTVRQDRDANQRFYGKRARTKQIVFGPAPGDPEPVTLWLQTLDRYSH